MFPLLRTQLAQDSSPFIFLCEKRPPAKLKYHSVRSESDRIGLLLQLFGSSLSHYGAKSGGPGEAAGQPGPGKGCQATLEREAHAYPLIGCINNTFFALLLFSRTLGSTTAQIHICVLMCTRTSTRACAIAVAQAPRWLQCVTLCVPLLRPMRNQSFHPPCYGSRQRKGYPPPCFDSPRLPFPSGGLLPRQPPPGRAPATPA